MKIALCDDNRMDVRHLRSFLKGQDVTVYEHAAELLADTEKEEKWFDLYLLDISMRHPMDAIELARTLRAWNEDAVICFTSESGGFYREVYDVYAVQYLLKPVQAEAVKRLLGRLSRSTARSAEQRVSFRWRGKLGFLAYDKILYVTSHGHTLLIYCTDGSVQKCVGKLNEMEEKICGETFCRCHQSFLVNLHYVEMLRGRELLVDENWIPVSHRYYAQIRHLLAGRICE